MWCWVGESGAMALRPVVARRAPRDGAVRHAGPAERAGKTLLISDFHGLLQDFKWSNFFSSPTDPDPEWTDQARGGTWRMVWLATKIRAQTYRT